MTRYMQDKHQWDQMLALLKLTHATWHRLWSVQYMSTDVLVLVYRCTIALALMGAWRDSSWHTGTYLVSNITLVCWYRTSCGSILCLLMGKFLV